MSVIVERAGVDELFARLAARGYKVVGPTVSQGAIVYDELRCTEDLPVGWADEQDGGHYRLVRRDDDALFGYAVGPHSWKKFQLPPEVTLWRAGLAADGSLTELEQPSAQPRYAFIGVRSCELHAMGILDRIRPAQRPFVVAVNCGQAGGTCFCVSMGTGPVAESGYDLVVTELLDDGSHRFLVAAGSEEGAAVLAELPSRSAEDRDEEAAGRAHARAASQMGREMDARDVRELLFANLDHPRWDDVADRCLTCGNCTMVCPTCFCTTVEDVTDLTGTTVERRERWDSCFTIDYSHMHGGSVRTSARSRYRQWMTHKLASWIDQFGTSGCVGCGRCITWCPVGIDITEEVAAIRGDDR
jgi:ferredoxin